MTREEITASLIADDIKAACSAPEEQKKQLVKAALQSVKLCLKPDGDPNPKIIKLLATEHGIRALWNKVDTGSSVEMKLGLKYGDEAFEVS